MDFKAFENLELIPILLNQVKEMNDRMKKFAPPITRKKDVAKFLEVTERTVNNYMAQGLLMEGYHYFHKSDRIIVFNEDKILEFRDKLARGLAHEKVAV